jgi:hypothetical protein
MTAMEADRAVADHDMAESVDGGSALLASALVPDPGGECDSGLGSPGIGRDLLHPGNPQQHPNIHYINVEKETEYRYSVSCSTLLRYLPQWLPHRLQDYINSFPD